MKCIFCHGELEETTTADLTEYDSFVVVIKDVPCFKCQCCGEIVYASPVVKQLFQIRKTLKSEKDMILNFKDVAS